MEYKIIGNFIICPMPEESELDTLEIALITSNTNNTWQHDRSENEKYKNTLQGKKAEIVIEKFLAENSELRFISYDKLRNDNFSKHAPFDGIIYRYNVSRHVLADIKKKINEDVENSKGNSGIISVDTRNFMEEQGVYTLEIKSSLLQDPRDYKCMKNKQQGTRTEEDYQALCQYIKGFYDYFVYPHYCRDDLQISSFYDYTKYVRDNDKYGNDTRNKQKFLYDLMRTEFDNACHIYTRVFFDILTNEIIIPGYITKTRFFEEPRIKKMPSPKSKNALYYMYHMEYGSSMLKIDKDKELLSWDREALYRKLFGAYQPNCPKCGNGLRIIETTKDSDRKKHKFLYICDCCSRNSKWYEVNKIHPKNMAVK